MYRKLYTAAHAAAHHGRQGRFYDRVLYSGRAADRPAVRPPLRPQALVQRRDRTGRSVLPVHDGRRLQPRSGHATRSLLRVPVLLPHSRHRPFFDQSGRRKNVLHPVFHLRGPRGHRHAAL